jgi:hypothetical protein
MKASLVLLPKIEGGTLNLPEWYPLKCDERSGLVFLPNVEELQGSQLQRMIDQNRIEIRGGIMTGSLFKQLRERIGVRIETESLENLTALLALQSGEPGILSC